MAANTNTKNTIIQNNINEHINKIVGTGVIDDETGKTLKLEFVTNFNDDQKFTFIESTAPFLDRLIEADSRLTDIKNKLEDNKIYSTETKNSWNSMTRNLGRLQTLIFIKDGRKVNCDEVTKDIIDALDAKITAVNDVIQDKLEQEQQQKGGNIKSYKHKYLKYKSKYLRIKNNI
jgi:hypothetical protein